MDTHGAACTILRWSHRGRERYQTIPLYRSGSDRETAQSNRRLSAMLRTADKRVAVKRPLEMKCIEIYINGKLTCRAGDDKVFHMHSSLSYLRERGTFTLVANGSRSASRDLIEYVHWAVSQELEIGDEVKIKLVDSDNPTEYSVGNSYGNREEGGVLRHFCSFCGKEASEERDMLTSSHANICNPCLIRFNPDKNI